MGRHSKFLLFSCIILICALFLYGCETLKGMGRDIEKVRDLDKEFEEKYW